MTQATRTTSIVFIVVPDPIGSHIVDNLARPQGNVTGLSTMAVELTPKRPTPWPSFFTSVPISRIFFSKSVAFTPTPLSMSSIRVNGARAATELA